MDATYRFQRHIYDATRKFYLLGRDQLIARLDPPPGGTVLEVGCGTARNLIAAARAWPNARFYGLDISDAMLATARASVERAQLTERITLVRADASTFDSKALFGISAFDRVFLSYTLSMIPPWQAALACAADAVAPDGRLAIVDFGQQERLPATWRKLLYAWLAKFHVTPRAALLDQVQKIADAHGLTVKTAALNRGYAVTAEMTRA